MKKKRTLFLIILTLLTLMPISKTDKLTISANAASKKLRNQKAHKLYEKKMNSIKAQHTEVNLYYKYANIIGDDTDELIISYHPMDPGHGSGWFLEIYTYKGNKAKRILSQIGYAGRIIAYKNKTLVCYTCSHANEIYEYYVTKNGKYKKSVYRQRYAKKAGAGKNTPWEYHNKAGKKISKAIFKRSIISFNGSKKTLNISKFKEWKKVTQTAATGENATYSLSPVAITSYQLSGTYLKTSTTDTIFKNDKSTTIKSLYLTINENCDYRYVNLGNRFPDNKTVIKLSAQEMSNYLEKIRGLPENGYFTLLITVQNGKMTKMVFKAL